MAQKKTYYQNPFYDDLFATFGLIVPSKRIRYKQGPDKIITDIITPRGTQEFERYIKQAFSNGSNPEWPYKCKILVAISISVKHSDYGKKDIDNICKSILDALKGVVFVDDVQVDALHIVKFPAKDYGFMIGIRKLRENDPSWFSPPMYSNKPFPKRQRYEIAIDKEFKYRSSDIRSS